MGGKVLSRLPNHICDRGKRKARFRASESPVPIAP